MKNTLYYLPYTIYQVNIIILGPAGSGKGTQAEKLAEKFNLIHIDMGKTLREVAKLDTPLGREIDEIIHVRKELVPVRIAEEVLSLKIGSIPREQGIIFEGVPRNMDQAGYIDKIIQESGRKIDKVIAIKGSLSEAKERISKRVVCGRCKAVFILGKDVESLDDPCPLCEGTLSQRIDDTPEGIEKRFEVFEAETRPVIEHYGKSGIAAEIDGEGSIEEVFERIISSLNLE